jgi:predicted P-loop ATPase
MKKWLVAMLAGWTDNEVVNHTILIFIGAQGTYKSTWMMNLMPPQLREYFKIKQNSGDLNKDDILAMSRYGLILHEELDAMGTKENNHMKAMTTAKNSSERKAYHREEMRRYNIASLCATGNNERFLSNDQGTRRMLVFRVQVVKPPIENPFNYEGIYSQAYSLLKNGFQYYFSPEEQARLEMHNKQFETVNMEEEMLSLWVRKPEPGETPLWMRTGQLADEIAARSHGHLRFNANKIGPILTARDFVKTKINGYYGYKVILRNYDEVLRHLKEMAINREESISQVSPSVQEQYERLLGERDDRELFNDDEN